MRFYLFTKTLLLSLSVIILLYGCKTDSPYNTEPLYTDSLSADSVSGADFIDNSFSKQLKVGALDIDIKSDGEEELKNLKFSLKSQGKDVEFEKGIKYDGIIQDALTADLNGDGRSEVYVFNQTAGSGSYGQVFAYQVNGNKLDSITMEDLPDDLSMQYLGHDSFALEKDHILRLFPLYNEMDANCCPSGGIKKLKYQLIKKANGLKLVISEK